MKIKEVRVNVTAVALSLALSAGGFAFAAAPVYALEGDPVDKTTEENIDEEQEVQEEVKEEVVEENKEEVQEEQQEEVQEEVVEENKEEVQEEVVEEKKEEVKEEVVEENKEEVKEEVQGETKEEVKEEAAPAKREVTETSNDAEVPEEHKVVVVTVKVDKEGNAIEGATLQILDKDGNVVDEWVSDGKEHISMLPEGEYTLHEANTPAGYIGAEDQSFVVKVEVNDITADVQHDDSHDVCWHYGGVPLYYIESEGEREEVYCINQDWDEPNGIDYNGLVLDENNLRTFTPDSDTSMSNQELYNKVLDIIYHRSKAEEFFPELSEVEVRFITEYALKTYTSAEVTTRQAKRDENGRIIRDEEGNIVYEDVRFLRQYRYDPESLTGYVEDRDNGDGLGKLAQHWWTAHNHTKIPAEYAELFYYLIGDHDKHPADMHLYVYSTKNQTADGESYQNLLGVRWFDPYDENYKTYLSVINEQKQTPPPEEPEKPPVTPDEPDKPVTPDKPVVEAKVSNSPQTGDETNGLIPALACLGSSITALGLMIGKRKQKVKE